MSDRPLLNILKQKLPNICSSVPPTREEKQQASYYELTNLEKKKQEEADLAFALQLQEEERQLQEEERRLQEYERQLQEESRDNAFNSGGNMDENPRRGRAADLPFDSEKFLADIDKKINIEVERNIKANENAKFRELREEQDSEYDKYLRLHEQSKQESEPVPEPKPKPKPEPEPEEPVPTIKELRELRLKRFV